MKLYRVLALVLAVLMVGVMLVACDKKEPEAVKTTVKVTVTIKDGPDGEVLAQERDYPYTYNQTGDEQPTIIDVVLDVCELNELTVEFQDESQQYISKIGNKSAAKGEFWTYALNGVNNLDLPMYEQTVAEGDVIVVYLDSLK
ncbi:MAG: DUF4430 domain-containing protein [Clostridia bacterium]|nr:DUF4430 domain-containing protein [Clostridia bacterium]MBQ2256146.1 DUF4430 domain-containing protein [Clostridia bacterium]MBQ5794161.1 DUF4430 domain-containing protein [Clostridia bacterium]